MEHYVGGIELKFAGDQTAAGLFSGYASVFNHQDSHGDVIMPGAFAASLAERKTSGRTIPMHVMHGIFGGDGVPVGGWQTVAEDDKGLRVEGKISGMNTDAGRLLFERVKDGALGGISIGFRVPTGGSTLGKKAGEAKRTIQRVNLHEISLVDDPSNELARVRETKALMGVADKDRATLAVRSAIVLHGSSMAGGDSPTAGERGEMLGHLHDAHEALTGQRVPHGMKAAPATAEEMKTELRSLGFNEQKAAEYAGLHFKKAPPTGDNGQGLAAALIAEFGGLPGFNLSTTR